MDALRGEIWRRRQGDGGSLRIASELKSEPAVLARKLFAPQRQPGSSLSIDQSSGPVLLEPAKCSGKRSCREKIGKLGQRRKNSRWKPPTASTAQRNGENTIASRTAKRERCSLTVREVTSIP